MTRKKSNKEIRERLDAQKSRKNKPGKFPSCIGKFPECEKYHENMEESERTECRLCPYK
jgi:hypothetical protein